MLSFKRSQREIHRLEDTQSGIIKVVEKQEDMSYSYSVHQ